VGNGNLNAAALQAGLNGKKKEQVDGLSKLLDSHKSLLALPATQAQTKFQTLPADQQTAHAAMFGGNKGPIGWLGDAAHYMGEKVKQTIALPFKAFNEASDFMTRVYRTGAIAVDQNVDLGKAFAIANDKGDKVFSPGRIENATKIYGKDMMSVAMKVASGMSLSEIIATGSEEEKQIASIGSQKKDKDYLLNDAIAAANASKYSPGRQLANLILPQSLEGSGFLYRGISGIGDAAYRIFSDPTLALGKAKKAYDAGDWFLYNVLGKEKFTYGRSLMASAGVPAQIDRIFADPRVTSLFNQYGQALGKLSNARGARNPIAGAEAMQQAKTLIPEFGDTGIQVFMNAGVRDAATAKTYLQNHSDVSAILKGGSARKTVLVPKMTAGRAIRVGTFTTANKVFNIDKVGQSIVRAIYGSEGPGMDVVGALTDESTRGRIGILEASVGRLKGKDLGGSVRYTDNQVAGRIDRFARKFATIPYFKNGYFDVMAPGAEDKVYQLAALANTRWHSKVIREAFAAGDEGQRRQIFTGLWDTVMEVRQVTRTLEGKNFRDQFSGKGLDYQYGANIVFEKVGTDGKAMIDELGNKIYEIKNPADFNGQQLALHGYQLSTSMAVPSIVDLDRLSAHSGIINRVLGISHKKWAQDVTDGWVVGTLAGPKFPVRNASEDIMFHLAIGDSPWGIVKGRIASTQLRKFKEAERSMTREQRKLGQEIQDLKQTISDATNMEGRIEDFATRSKLASDAAKAKEILATKQADIRKLQGSKIKFYESELGFMNRLIGRGQVKEFQIKIAEAGDNVEEVRKVMAEAMITNKLSSRVLTDLDKKYISEFGRYGHTQEVLADVAEGTKNTLRGGDYSIQVSNDAKEYGRLGAIEYDGKAYKQSGSAFEDFNPVASEKARLGWLVKIALHTNDEVDSILLKNLDNKELAIQNLTDYLEATPALRGRFQSMSGGIATTREHAERAYIDVLNTFSKKNGKLNEDLWRKIRREGPDGKISLSSKTLSVDDLPKRTDADLHPTSISGPNLIPVGESNNIANSMVSQLWDYMGQANARFSRDGIVFDSMLDIRKNMDETGFAKRVYDELTYGKTGAELDKAHEYAMRHITSIVEDMAKKRVLSYVDNPEVRSQLAFSVRNFARFYRATEDFYRRVYRTVKYNPEALVRASLTYEGIAHSGFVQTDENGEQYFFYPGLTPVYKVMEKVMKIFGVQDGFKAPMPVEFGAKIKMFTPSLNPDAIFPTFAGPVSAVPLKVIGNLIPQTKDLENYLTGGYGANQSMIEAILPAHVNRLLQGLNKDERNSQFASAARKSATYLEATGHGIEIKIDPETGLEVSPSPAEVSAYQDKLQASTFTVLGLRFLFAFFAPASPSVNLKSDMEKWVRDNGQTTYKATFNDLRTRYGDIDKTTKEWIRLFPDQMPYTISESQATTIAPINAVGAATEWINQNSALLGKYKEAGAFLIPNVGTFDFNAYKLLFKSGLKVNKTLTDFLSEVSSAKDKQIYFSKKDEFDQQMSFTTSTDGKRMLRDEWQTWADEFKGARPSLQDELSGGSKKAIQRTRAIDDLRKMLQDKTVTAQPALRKTLKEMLDIYDSYISERDFSSFSSSGNIQDYKDMLKLNAQSTLQAIAEGDPNALAAYNSLFAPLFQ
jgi:uncharacterized protein (UPF0216 family)